MQIVFYIVIVLSALLALGILTTAAKQKDYAMFGGGFSYLLGANFAYFLDSWWPLLGGFIVVWIINLIFKGKYSQ